MPVIFAILFGAFGLVSSLTGYFLFDFGLLSSLAMYVMISGVAPLALVFLNTPDDGTDFVERRAVSRNYAN